MTKPVKVYELYWTARGPTCYSEHYGRYSKRVTLVAAVSVKQAYFKATHREWCPRLGEPGILADYGDGGENWRLYTGERTCCPPWEHYQRLPRTKS